MLADHFGGNYGISMAIISGLIAIAVAGLAGFGPQAKEVQFTGATATE